jgi:hypothetical protein
MRRRCVRVSPRVWRFVFTLVTACDDAGPAPAPIEAHPIERAVPPAEVAPQPELEPVVSFEPALSSAGAATCTVTPPVVIASDVPCGAVRADVGPSGGLVAWRAESGALAFRAVDSNGVPLEPARETGAVRRLAGVRVLGDASIAVSVADSRFEAFAFDRDGHTLGEPVRPADARIYLERETIAVHPIEDGVVAVYEDDSACNYVVLPITRNAAGVLEAGTAARSWSQTYKMIEFLIGHRLLTRRSPHVVLFYGRDQDGKPEAVLALEGRRYPLHMAPEGVIRGAAVDGETFSLLVARRGELGSVAMNVAELIESGGHRRDLPETTPVVAGALPPPFDDWLDAKLAFERDALTLERTSIGGESIGTTEIGSLGDVNRVPRDRPDLAWNGSAFVAVWPVESDGRCEIRSRAITCR